LRIGPGVAPWDRNRWEAGAKVIQLDVQDTGAVEREVPAHDFIGQDVIVGVRIINPKGRASEWSNLVSLAVRPPVPPPVNLQAASVETGVKLTWQADAPSYRIFRATGEEEPALIGNSDKPEYVDAAAQYGANYRYLVQAMNGNAESVISAAASITPEDRFPPSPPGGLTAAPGAGAIELVWDRSPAPDLKDYRVYRALDQQAFQQIGEVETPAYSDRQVETGKTYRYAVTAVDQKGNESEKSAVAQATAP
jgi:fibronectin type 3 domain-containing protein